MFLFPAVLMARMVRRSAAGVDGGKSDFKTRPGPVNSSLAMLFGAERYLLRRLNLPFGVSLLAVARKPAAPR